MDVCEGFVLAVASSGLPKLTHVVCGAISCDCFEVWSSLDGEVLSQCTPLACWTVALHEPAEQPDLKSGLMAAVSTGLGCRGCLGAVS